MKYTRLLLGLLIIVGALWVLVGEQIAGASSDAFVNARVVTLRADVAGKLSLRDRVPGAAVSAGEVLGEVSDPLVDNVRLNDLLLEADLKTAQIEGLTRRINDGTALRTALQERVDIYRAARVEELEARLAHARQRLEILETQPGYGDRDQELADAADDTVDRIPGAPALPALALEHARERVAVLEIALKSARDGVFLGDGYNDTTNAGQRATEIGSEIAAAKADLQAAKADLAAIETRVSREKVRVNSLTGGDLQSPVDGLYWEALQGDGVTVQRGDPVLRLVDCASTLVSASVPENVYNTLRPGQAATFRMTGDARTFDATISRLAGAGAATVYEHMAIAPSRRHLERYDVTLIVPGLAQAPELACAVGRTGRVFFDRRPLDGLRHLFD